MEEMREDKELPEEDKKPEETPEVSTAPEDAASEKTETTEDVGEDEASEKTETTEDVGEDEALEEKTEAAKEETPEESGGEVSEEPKEETPEEVKEDISEDISQKEDSEAAKEETPGEAGGKASDEATDIEEATADDEEEPRAKRHYGRYIAAAAAAVVIIGGGAYLGAAQQYSAKFFPNTTINYIDVSNLTLDEVKDSLDKGIEDYSLKLITRDGEEEISGLDIGLSIVYDDSIESWISSQNPYMWGMHLFQDTPYIIQTMVSFDPDLLDEAVTELPCMDYTAMIPAINATISDYDEATGSYSIVAEIPGTVINKRKLTDAVSDAIHSLQPELVLADTDIYREAEITSENPELLALLDEYNQYAGMTVVYDFGDEQEVLDGSRIHTWLNTVEDGSVTVDKNAVSEYVKDLADKYDTTSRTRTLKTTYGPSVTLTKGNYGWKISQSKETDALVDIILSGVGEEREPIYQQTAVGRGEQDYGDTYVEINLTAQHLYYYKDGALVIESDLVSGNESNGNATPDGAYYLAYKQRNAVLRGPRRADGSYEYESPVSYWMPFNGGIGLHDATWRGSFGGSIYKTNGSHGCINLPVSVARTIFENIEAGTPVFCYRLGSTEPTRTATSGSSSGSRSSSSGSRTTSSSSSSAAAAVAETVPAIQQIEDTTLLAEAAQAPAAAEAVAEAEPSSGSSNVIVAGQSKTSAGPGEQQTYETSPVVVAGQSQTTQEEASAQAAASAEAQAAAVSAEAQAAAPVETQAAAPVEAQAAAPVEAQAAAPVEAQAAAVAEVPAAAPVEVPAAAVAEPVAMEAP